MEAFPINRRDAMITGVGLVGAGLVSETAHAASASSAVHSGGQISTDSKIVVETSAGRIRGFSRGGIYTFKGVPYGASTEGTARFRPAKPPTPWTGVRSTLTYGPVSPHPTRGDWGHDETQFVYDWDDGYASEDCLRVNVWTPEINGTGRKPVLVWIHGGGFTSGSSQELPSYDGENIARRGDVVLVSMNHRLGALGFMDLSAIGGADFADSGNLSMLDLVAALRWIRENIGRFGGDPGNVTIFGQSGGGSKVSTLMAMPAAKGLFHRAIVMSGSFGAGGTPEDAQRLAAATLAELNLAPGDIPGLQKVRPGQLIAAGDAAMHKLMGPPSSILGGPIRSMPRVGWQPVWDGRNVPPGAWVTGAPEAARDVPLMVGNVREEFIDSSLQFDEAELNKRVQGVYAEKAPGILAAFRRDFPTVAPAKLFAMINAMALRNGALRQLDQKHAQGGAPGYSYWFTWQPPVLESRAGAFHCIDIAFAMDNTKRCEQATGDTPEARMLAASVSQAWINFARTGNPSPPGVTWPAYDPNTKPTLVFDLPVKVVNDPASASRRSVV